MTRRSLNEIEVTARKAALGSGLVLGHAEDAGRSCTWLLARQLLTLRDYLRSLGAEDSALVAGPGLADLFAADPSTSRDLDRVDLPLLCLPPVVFTLPDTARPVTFSWGGSRSGQIVLTATDAFLIHHAPNTPGPVRITPGGTPGGAALSTRHGRSLDDGIDINGEQWSALETLAAKTLVPATAASRAAGAGAGDIDNE